MVELVDGKPAHGSLAIIARNENVAHSRVLRLWQKLRTNQADPANSLSDVSLTPKRKAARLGFRKHTSEGLKTAIKRVDPKKRKTVRGLAKAIGIPASTLHLYKSRDSLFIKHNSRLKPKLSDDHKRARLLFAFDHVTDDNTFADMFDEVHVDEKWFYIVHDKEGFYILPEEKEDREEMRKFHRSTQHKGHIEKVMFLAATARPRFDAEGHCVFDGKVGIWPFTGVRLAERNSVNRPAGTELLVNVNCTKETYKQKLLECVIPAIREKFPVNNWDANRPIRIQQDNATPHRVCNDADIVEALSGNAEKPLTLYFQPPQSPDTNINDLAFFRAIQSLQQTMHAKNKEELLATVVAAWDQYPPRVLNRMWLTLMSCFDETIQDQGGNDYSIPHHGKAALEATDELPVTLELSEGAVEVINVFNLAL
jgi:hypothetical protein